MTAIRDRIFISYSREDGGIYAEVKQKLLDEGLGDRICDDTDLRTSDQWDERIQDMLDRTAVAVLILSDHYFRRLRGGDEYILKKELPYFLEHYRQGDMDLLPLYWSPSPHFAPDRRDRIKPFEYEWPPGQARSFDIQSIQAEARNGRLAAAGPQEQLDALQRLAREADRRLGERLGRSGPRGDAVGSPARHALTIELTIDSSGVRRVVKGAERPCARARRASPARRPTACAPTRVPACPRPKTGSGWARPCTGCSSDRRTAMASPRSPKPPAGTCPPRPCPSGKAA
jgi:hypothetical protein